MEFDKIYFVNCEEKKIRRAFFDKDVAILTCLKLKIDLSKIEEIEYNETESCDFDYCSKSSAIEVHDNYEIFEFDIETENEHDASPISMNPFTGNITEEQYWYLVVHSKTYNGYEVDGSEFSDQFKKDFDKKVEYLIEKIQEDRN